MDAPIDSVMNPDGFSSIFPFVQGKTYRFTAYVHGKAASALWGRDTIDIAISVGGFMPFHVFYEDEQTPADWPKEDWGVGTADPYAAKIRVEGTYRLASAAFNKLDVVHPWAKPSPSVLTIQQVWEHGGAVVEVPPDARTQTTPANVPSYPILPTPQNSSNIPSASSSPGRTEALVGAAVAVAGLIGLSIYLKRQPVPHRGLSR